MWPYSPAFRDRWFAPEKRAPLVPYGVGIVTVSGVGRQATASAENDLFRHVSGAAERHGLFLGITAHAFNPDGMRGVDTLGYELAGQLPDATHVYLPAGGGGLLTATVRGLRHRGIALASCPMQMLIRAIATTCQSMSDSVLTDCVSPIETAIRSAAAAHV